MKSANLVDGERWLRGSGAKHVWTKNVVELSWDKKRQVWVACVMGAEFSNSESAEEAWTNAMERCTNAMERCTNAMERCTNAIEKCKQEGVRRYQSLGDLGRSLFPVTKFSDVPLVYDRSSSVKEEE